MSRVTYAQLPDGRYALLDTATGDRAIADDWVGVQQYIADRSAAPGYMGAGDIVRAATRRMGVAPCGPCAERQQAMNGVFPRLFRR